MRPIRLPEPPNGSFGVPEIFDGRIYGVIRRAIVIGNGFPGAENQCLGLVRALGLSGRHSLYVSILLFPEITCINYAFTKSKFWSSFISQIKFDHNSPVNSINFRVLWGLVVCYIYCSHSTICNLLSLSEIFDGNCMEDTLVNAYQKLGWICKLLKRLALFKLFIDCNWAMFVFAAGYEAKGRDQYVASLAPSFCPQETGLFFQTNFR